VRVVTVHRGARDAYQVAGALEEAGLLEALVTDLYWPADRVWACGIERVAPQSLSAALRCRYGPVLGSDSVVQCWGSGLSSLAVAKTHGLSFDCQRKAVRWCDRILGERAARIANRKRAALLSYSYYAYSAFSHYSGDQPRILFQLHPQPASVRAILLRELELHPDCRTSLDKEWELALPDEDLRRLAAEATMADHWLVASHFTKLTLTEAGIPSDRIGVVPYGVDLKKFAPRTAPYGQGRPLRLLFVGTLAQRKGIKYLIEALNLLPTGSVELTACGRPVDNLELFRQSRAPVHLRKSISAEGLLAAYRSADVFVFPSLAEGFGHVLLEAMASGLPVISTSRTAAPDLVREAEEGFIVEAGNSLELAACIEKFLERPATIRSMGEAARRRAEHFTWERFRRGVAAFVGGVLRGSSERPVEEPCLLL
jgi:glycosyltransferase involved in cell wall biosynthesis